MRLLASLSALVVLVLAIPAATPLLAQGPGDLLVTPTRAIFENGKRFETLTLINRGEDTASYRISMVQYRMTPDGNLERIDSTDAGQLVATDLVRFFPREVTIAPGESQNVRLQLKLPEGLADGEYRSHLLFRGVERKQAGEDTIKGDFAVKLTAVYGVSVPVIIRQGRLSAEVTLENVKLEPATTTQKPMISMAFHRSGTRSVSGTVRVTFVTPEGDTRPIASMGGVAVYTPNTTRFFRMPLDLPAGLDLRRGTLRVSYESVSESSSETLASADAKVQ